MIEFKATNRGFLLGEFKDRFGAQCSIQESSYPDEPCIWVGIEVDSANEAVPLGRMHLTRDQARYLSEVLRYFAEEGALGLYDTSDYQIGQWVVGIGKDNRDLRGRVVEMSPQSHIVVQNDNRPGEAGLWKCAWERVQASWLPTDAPEEGPSLYERIGLD